MGFMSWRDLKPLDDRYELQHPEVESGRPGTTLSEVTLTIADEPSREWFTEWLRSKRCWAAFMTWVDEKR